MVTIEVAVGPINGLNTLFSTPTPFKPGTVRFLLNGVFEPDDCITELNPSAGLIQWLGTVPSPGDIVQLFYDSATTGLPVPTRVCQIVGVARSADRLIGALQIAHRLGGIVTARRPLSGILVKCQD